MRRPAVTVLPLILLTAILGIPAGVRTAAAVPSIAPAAEQSLRELLDRECNHLDKEKLYTQITASLGAELEQGMAPDLLKIMEGVIKRTDFDTVSEEKTTEIIGLVYGAFKKGAPLAHLDDVFDVAYVNTVTVDQLAAAARALQEFHRSNVPQEFFDEFVYHSLEEGWDPAVTPVLARGLIYGVDRGLSPNRVALIIMLDVKNGELKNKTADQLVLDALKLVREKEPRNWKPMTPGERDLAAKQDRTRELERKKGELDEELEQRERAFVMAQTQIRELREFPDRQPTDADVQKLNRDLEALLRKLQGEITRYQTQQKNIVVELETTRKDVGRRQASRDRERRQRREQDLARTQQDISSRGKQGRFDRGALESAVDRLLGTPYRFGGDSERGIDCSAFTRRVYRSQGVELPRNSREQARVGLNVAFGSLRAGDLVFFDTSINGTISHVGVYLGNGVFAHASSSKGVTKSAIKEKYYAKRFVKGGRIFND